MSAIFGILRFDGAGVSARDLERMSNTLAHRGPDGRKFTIDGAVGLGHCLMRVNNEDVFEAQPLRDREADLTLVADCRIDNREELAAVFGIAPPVLRDMPDGALVLRAYKKWGENCAEHLLGDFSFAIWDGRSKKLYLARDHMGQRNIEYHRGDRFFVFATEVKALWACPDVPRLLSDVQIGRELVFARPRSEGETQFDGIDCLPGGTVMAIDAAGEVRKHRYWEPRADPAHEGRDEAYYIGAYRRVLGEAVACRLRRIERTPGLMFSGGYDSAAIAGLAGPALAGRKLIAAASVMPADYQGTIRHARRWVEMCARDMPYLDVRYVTREGKNILSDLEQAYVETGMLARPQHFADAELLSTLANAGARLIMDGHGGDYTLNPMGQAALARFLGTFQFRRFFTELRGHLRFSGHSFRETLKQDIAMPLLPQNIIMLWRQARRRGVPLWRNRPVYPAFAEHLITQGALGEKDLRGGRKPIIDMRRRMAATAREMASLPIGPFAARAALRRLELTRPFHDKRVVELALSIPQELYVKNGRNRYLACASLKDIYPREFQTRWRKKDAEIPDFHRMIKSIEPQLLAEIAQMEKSEELSRMIDFAKIRTYLAARGPDDHNSGWEPETQLAAHGILVARYVTWFRRENC